MPHSPPKTDNYWRFYGRAKKLVIIIKFDFLKNGELSKPDEYNSPANIPEYVINDIATWVQGKSK